MDPDEEIYYGDRGQEFRQYIKETLARGRIKPKYISAVLTDDNMKILDAAFTHESANPNRNYQFLENLGDSSANKVLVWYFSRRFPQINCPEGVNTLARLKINYGAKKSYAAFGKKLGLWPYVSASASVREARYSKTMEDVFEAFIAAIEKILDEAFVIGVGYSAVYDIMKSLMDTLDISLEYTDLFDAKSRLNETICFYLKENKLRPWYQKYKDKVSSYLKYVEEKNAENRYVSQAIIQNLEIKGRPLREPKVIGSGVDYVKVEAEIKASEEALKWLARNEISKPIPQFYETYCQFSPEDFM